MKTLNQMVMERKGKSVLDINLGQNIQCGNVPLVIAFNNDLKEIGFKMDKELLDALLRANNYEQLLSFVGDTYESCLFVVGAHVEHKPMYRNFPATVATKTDDELKMDQLMGYMCDQYSLIESYVTGVQIDLRETVKFDTISDEFYQANGTEADKAAVERKLGFISRVKGLEIFTELLSMKNSLSEKDITDIEYVLKSICTKEEIQDFFPLEYGRKENMCFAYGLYSEIGTNCTTFTVSTATDVLRIATSLSKGDISLGSKTKFKSFKRSERRAILAMLENVLRNAAKGKEQKVKYVVDGPLTDMIKYKEQWKRLNEKLHCNEYKSKYPYASNTLAYLFKGINMPKTFNARVDEGMKAKNYEHTIQLLSQRSGEFARKLNWILNNENGEEVIRAFEKVAAQVPVLTLLQLKSYFSQRNDLELQRCVFPKGKKNSFYIYKNEKETELLQENLLTMLNEVIEDAIRIQLANKPGMGNVYISDAMKNINVPVSNRSASAGCKTLTRGSKVQLNENAKFIRLFIYWIGEDVDLSATFYSEDFKKNEIVSWYTLMRSKNAACYHSGDITRAAHGASEFIDVDIDRMIAEGFRYIAMDVHSYSGINFKDIKECFTGVMERETVNSQMKQHSDFNAKTVKVKIDLNTPNTSSSIAMFDLVKRELIWLDFGVDRHYLSVAQKGYYEQVMKSFIRTKRPTLFELMRLNVEARGGVLVNESTWTKKVTKEVMDEEGVLKEVEVEITEKADIIVDFDGDITPYDFETILTAYV